MPELPEVETIRSGLQKYTVGKKIESVEVRLAKQFHGDPKNVEGAVIEAVKRFGKGLVIELSNEYALAIHIKMTGQLIYRDKKVTNTGKYINVPNPYTHVIFHLSDNAYLYYNDIRQFGWIRVVKRENLQDESFFRGLGPEPLKNLSFEKFERILKTATKIKPLLMDQQKIAGIGNIYANDALFLAKIDPRRPAKSLSSEEQEKLFQAIETVLKKGIKEGGSSENNYVNALGEQGNYQKHSLVYGKVGKPCPNCQGKIEKITLGGRGTFFCPKCQK